MLTRLATNTVCMYGAFVIRKLSVLFLAMAIAREGGVKGFGLYCLALVLMEFGGRVAVFGTDILIIRDLSSSHPEGGRIAGNAMTWRLLAGGIIGSCLFAVGMSMNDYAPFHRAVGIMAVGMVADTLADLYLSVIQGRERIDLYAFTEGTTGVIGLGLGAAALIGGLGLDGLAAAYALRGVSSLVMGSFLCRRLGQNVAPLFDPHYVVGMLKEAAPIAVSRLLTIVYLGSGAVVLQYFHGAAAVGRFSGSMKIFESCAAAGMLTMVASFPLLARLRSGSADELRDTAGYLLGFFCWLGLPLSAVVALNADFLLRTVFGAEFASCGPALIVLMAALPFSLVYGLVERLAYAAHDQRQVLVARGIGTLVNMAVLLLLIDRAGYLAPAIAILAAEAAMCAVFARYWSRYVPGFKFQAVVFPPAGALLLAIGPLLVVRSRFGAYDWLVFSGLFLALALLYGALRSRLSPGHLTRRLRFPRT